MSTKSKLRSRTNKLFRNLGLGAEPQSTSKYPPDFTDEVISICEQVHPYTMTSPERVNALVNAVNYLVANKIEGAFVECGVWKGGSAMAMMLALKQMNDYSRHLYLYDTYSGMSAPSEADISALSGSKAEDNFTETKINDDSSDWCYSALDEVKANISSIQYSQNVHFIKGKVEDTIPDTIPSEIALLRLDTDWYESTKHELEHLYPRLKKGGILIIDDYGHWEGAKKAVDEYLSKIDNPLLLNRIDYTARLAIKP